jgi:diguanylate cyclase (GGDEF)-like protein
MIAGVLDVLLVSDAEVAEIDELSDAGLQVERLDSVVSAIVRLQAVPTGLVVVGYGLCAGREVEVFSSLREAGARAVLALLPPQHSWRAAQALAAGADDSVVLPAPPGEIQSRALRILRTSASLAPAPASDSAPPPNQPLELLVNDIAIVNRSIGELDRLLGLVLDLFVRRTDAERASLMLVDETGGELQVRKSIGLPASAANAKVAVGTGLAGHVAQSGAALVTSDVEEVRAALLPVLREPRGKGSKRVYRTRSCLLLPLRGTRGVLGVVCLADRRSRRAFEDADRESLTFLAEQAAQAVENALQFRQLAELATIDELTGLSNRRHFQLLLDREMQRARRYSRPLTLALFDVDHFKRYNDTCGHQAGDQALAALGRILRGSLREVDLVARYGGEEFAAILPETKASAVAGAGVSPFPFLERLRRRVEEAVFPGEDKLPTGKLTLSGGIACFPDDAESVEDLVREADRALYVSKERGRNTITWRGAALPS